jgi:uncharacterized membrane protein
MPYEWIEAPAGQPGQPRHELHLWPFRSLPKRGFVTFIACTLGLVSIPLIAVIGTAVLWGVLPFVILTIGAVWWAIERSYKDGSVLEELCLWEDRVTLTRHNPRGPVQDWEANPHWVTLTMHDTGGPVEHYLTLRGNGREVEIGAFLSAEERRALYGELRDALRAVT